MEKSLHDLNMEQRAIDAAMRQTNVAAADAARDATLNVLDGRRPDGRRVRKNVRPTVTENAGS